MSLDNTPSVYIIVVTYNAMPWIQRCLESCKGYPVVVVDNNSTDGSVAYIASNFPGVHLCKQTENLGFGGGNNLGIREAFAKGADYVYLLNQDVYLDVDTIELLVNTHKNNLEYGVLSPMHYKDGYKELDTNFGHYIHDHYNSGIMQDLKNGALKSVYQVPFVNAAGWLVSKQALLDVGLFDPLFFMYVEDDNLCQRMEYHGYKIGIVPAARMIHDRGNRKEKVIEEFSDTYFLKLRNRYLYQLADINNNHFEDHYKKEVYHLKKIITIQKLKFAFTKAANYKKQLKMLQDLYPQIIVSRNNNSLKGSYFIK